MEANGTNALLKAFNGKVRLTKPLNASEAAQSVKINGQLLNC